MCLGGRASDPESSDAPGLVVLRDDWSVESLTRGVERWPAELPDGDWKARGKLPPAALAVAGRALRTAEHADAPGEVALSRVLSREGRWIVLHGGASCRRRAPRGGHRGAGPSCPNLSPAHGCLPVDRARAGRHPSGTARRLHIADRRSSVRFTSHRAAASEERVREVRRSQPTGACLLSEAVLVVMEVAEDEQPSSR